MSNHTGNLIVSVNRDADFDEVIATMASAGLTVLSRQTGSRLVLGSPTGGPNTLEAVKAALWALPGVKFVDFERDGYHALQAEPDNL
jgi:hypothetical protein